MAAAEDIADNVRTSPPNGITSHSRLAPEYTRVRRLLFIRKNDERINPLARAAVRASSARSGSVNSNTAPPPSRLAGGNRAAMRFDDGADDGEAHAHAVFLRGVEGIEHGLFGASSEPIPYRDR